MRLPAGGRQTGARPGSGGQKMDALHFGISVQDTGWLLERRTKNDMIRLQSQKNSGKEGCCMEVRKFNKVLVANRGEIALRIFRACYDLACARWPLFTGGYLQPVPHPRGRGVSDRREQKPAGRLSGHPGHHRPAAPPAAWTPSIPATASCRKTRSSPAPASRRASRSSALPQDPRPDGDKLTAKTIAHECGVPTIPGSDRPLADTEDAIAKAEEFGYPVLLKAAGGGGGPACAAATMPRTSAWASRRSRARRRGLWQRGYFH